MATMLFIIAGAGIATAAAYVMTSRSAVHAALAGQNTAVGLTDPAAETLPTGTEPRNRVEWHLTTLDDLTDAEDLLDSLEAHGVAERELVVLGNSSFVVRWR